jgi:glyoxylase-like metal-dependent hydrolase (beta-lactamase superfamily II)
MGKVHATAEGIWLIDTCMAEVPEFTAVYAIRGNEGAALVDSGVSVSSQAILDSLSEAAIGREEVLYIIVTHIHLDHAGGAGYLLQELPNARAIIASRGIEIMAHPERLVASARRSLGKIADMYGDMVPVDRSRLMAAEEAGTLELGGKTLRIVPSPGHAATHQCVVEEKTATLFSGDSLGIYLPDEGKVIPVTPPPDFDLEEQRRTLERLADLDCVRTCFTHYGCGGDCASLARQSMRNLELMVETVREGMLRETDPKRVAGELIRIMDVSSPYGMFMFGGMSLLNVHGIMRYLERAG